MPRIPYVHDDCGAQAELIEDVEPGPPDRYGNRFLGIRCTECGETGDVLIHKHGNSTPEKGWTRIETNRKA